MNKITRILAVVVTCLVIGYFSGMVTRSSVTTWFPTLIKPSFNPPSWVFAPVWSILFVMMGVAAGLVWDRNRSRARSGEESINFLCDTIGIKCVVVVLVLWITKPNVSRIRNYRIVANDF